MARSVSMVTTDAALSAGNINVLEISDSVKWRLIAQVGIERLVRIILESVSAVVGQSGSTCLRVP